ncbi:MAG: TonB-dependent siderophore receptor [Symploca sp. SIO2B6]|nr:TonB-dependent siderophore receptor [Symploca sp. SIO2B6]
MCLTAAIPVLIAFPANADVVKVTTVLLKQTDGGIEVILETADGASPQVFTASFGETLIADVVNTQLQLPSGDEFRADNPAEGIASITVTQLYTNTIRVRVTGITSIPEGQLIPSSEGLVLRLSTTTHAAAQLGADSTKPDEVSPSVSGGEVSPETVPDAELTAPSAEEPQPQAEADEQIEIVVTAEQESGYRVPSAVTGTRTETPLRDVPQSIQVIPRQVIEDRQIVRFNELADNVSGVQGERGYGGLSQAGFRIRGFSTNFSNLRNGFSDFGYISTRDVANVERFEVLKGPASVLYGGGGAYSFGGGAGVISGVVNTVTKKPLDQPYYDTNATYGSFDFLRSTLDITGPLLSNQSLLYRLNVAYENADSFRDFNENESFFIAPVLTWKINPRTNLTVELEHQQYDGSLDFGFPVERDFLEVPRERFLGEPDFTDADTNSTLVSYNFEHQFSDNWKLKQGFNATFSNLDSDQIFPLSLEDDRRTVPRLPFKTDERSENLTLSNSISGKFSTGAVNHNLLLGVDLARYRYRFDFFRSSIASLDVFDPQYGAQPGSFRFTSGSDNRSRNIGIFLQDLVEVTPHLKLLAGGRFDFYDSSRRNRVTDEFLNEQTDERFSPRIGIVYQPSDSTSLYFSWSNSFAPQFGRRTREDGQLEPEIGEQFELGIKQSFLDERLSATLALYEFTRKNVLTPDPVDPLFSIQTGEQRSRGIELDIAGEILPGWNLIATYTYTDAEVTEDEVIPEGDRPYGVPENSTSLWTTYEIQKGDLQGLGFGLGLLFFGEHEVVLPNTFTLPSYVRVDASLFYRRNNFKAALNFKNISDVTYYLLDGALLGPASPFTVQGTVSFEF